jgi:DNA-binding beta-propeller fold protein YncE
MSSVIAWPLVPAIRAQEIRPSLVALAPGGRQEFRVEGASAPVTVAAWSVDDVPGGSGALGRIGADGVYTAPARPGAREASICARLAGKGGRRLWATVIVGGTPPRYRPLRRWGEKGTGRGQFLWPHGITLDPDGHLLVTDSTNSRVYRFSAEGKLLGEIGGGPGSGDGQFRAPRDVKIGRDGHILVLDGDNRRIQEFDAAGRFLRAFGRQGTGFGELLGPHALALGAGGRIYVLDDDNHRLTVFGATGRPEAIWDGQGGPVRSWAKPHGLDVDPNGDVFACNFYLPCYKLSSRGELRFVFAPPRPDTGPVIVHGVGIDRHGNAYLAARDAVSRHSIMKFNNNGSFVTSWPAPDGARKYECIAVDRVGKIYVTLGDADRPGVEVYAPEP